MEEEIKAFSCCHEKYKVCPESFGSGLFIYASGEENAALARAFECSAQIKEPPQFIMEVNMNNTSEEKKTTGRFTTRYIVGTAMLSALAFVLQYIEVPIPIMPSFIKFDFSDLPALIGAFAYGPLAGVIIELIKNLIHCAVSQSATVGELSNFILGAVFAAVAGIIYKRHKTKKTALIGSIAGALAMGLISIPSNYFVVYPFYYNFMPKEVVLQMYQAILPGMKTILQCLVVFNLPFTIVKGLVSALITFLIYKKISPILKGNK